MSKYASSSGDYRDPSMDPLHRLPKEKNTEEKDKAGLVETAKAAFHRHLISKMNTVGDRMGGSVYTYELLGNILGLSSVQPEQLKRAVIADVINNFPGFTRTPDNNGFVLADHNKLKERLPANRIQKLLDAEPQRKFLASEIKVLLTIRDTQVQDGLRFLKHEDRIKVIPDVKGHVFYYQSKLS